MDRWQIAVLTFLTSVAVSFILIRQTIPFATARGMLDTTGPRKVNPNRLPRIAGPAILVAFLTGLAMTSILRVDRFPSERNRLLLLVIASVLLVSVMVIDDIRGISAGLKLGIQIVVAAVLVVPYGWDRSWGIAINQFNVPIAGTIRFGTTIAILFSLFWIVGMMNTINLIDGLDGLASSLTLVACTILFLHTYFWPRDDPQFTISLLPLALAGAVIGFLPFNWHPSKIILGDAGAYFLGLGLGVSAIIGGAKIATALLALGLPIIDVAWVAVDRLQRRSSPLAADRGHLHHRLLDLGLSQPRIVTTVAGVSLAFGIASLLLPSRGLKLGAIVIVGVILLATVIVVATVDEQGKRTIRTRLPLARDR